MSETLSHPVEPGLIHQTEHGPHGWCTMDDGQPMVKRGVHPPLESKSPPACHKNLQVNWVKLIHLELAQNTKINGPLGSLGSQDVSGDTWKAHQNICLVLEAN